jgi:hypothetical protein
MITLARARAVIRSWLPSVQDSVDPPRSLPTSTPTTPSSAWVLERLAAQLHETGRRPYQAVLTSARPRCGLARALALCAAPP